MQPNNTEGQPDNPSIDNHPNKYNNERNQFIEIIGRQKALLESFLTKLENRPLPESTVETDDPIMHQETQQRKRKEIEETIDYLDYLENFELLSQVGSLSDVERLAEKSRGIRRFLSRLEQVSAGYVAHITQYDREIDRPYDLRHLDYVRFLVNEQTLGIYTSSTYDDEREAVDKTKSKIIRDVLLSPPSHAPTIDSAGGSQQTEETLPSLAQLTDYDSRRNFTEKKLFSLVDEMICRQIGPAYKEEREKIDNEMRIIEEEQKQAQRDIDKEVQDSAKIFFTWYIHKYTNNSSTKPESMGYIFRQIFDNFAEHDLELDLMNDKGGKELIPVVKKFTSLRKRQKELSNKRYALRRDFSERFSQSGQQSEVDTAAEIETGKMIRESDTPLSGRENEGTVASTTDFEIAAIGDILSNFPQDVQQRFKASIQKYGSAYQDVRYLQDESGKNLLELAIRRVRESFADIMKKIGITPSDWGNTDKWIIWDIAKQRYLSQHPEESNAEYTLADPFGDNNTEILQDITDRHVGWEVIQYIRNNPESTFYQSLQKDDTPVASGIKKLLTEAGNTSREKPDLPSYKLLELGRLIKTYIL